MIRDPNLERLLQLAQRSYAEFLRDQCDGQNTHENFNHFTMITMAANHKAIQKAVRVIQMQTRVINHLMDHVGYQEATPEDYDDLPDEEYPDDET